MSSAQPLCVLAFACLLLSHAAAQGPQATLTFDLEAPAQTPPHSILLLNEDDSGSYAVPAPEQAGALEFHLCAGAAASWFADARALNFFNGKFQSSRKVAFTGNKVLTYRGPDGSGSAGFTYTENPRLAALLVDLQQLEETLRIGQRLSSDMRFNKLGLDADMETLQRLLKDHSASHPEAIAVVLQKLIDDPGVMKRVSRAASMLLASVQMQPAESDRVKAEGSATVP